MTQTVTKLTNKQKAALVIIMLGTEKAAKVYRHLSNDEVEQLTVEVASIKNVDKKRLQSTLDEFNGLCLASQYVAEGGVNYAREILDRAYGSKTAIQLISKITQSLHEHSFEFLRKADTKHLLNFIQNEHPQTIALILLYTTPEQAAAILSALPREEQLDVSMRIATMDRTSPEIIKAIESVLEKKLSVVSSTNFTEVGGIKPVADILNRVDRATEKYILDEFDKRNHELSEKVRSRMFVFEDIVLLDSRGIQRVLHEVNSRDLAVAMKGANDDVKTLIFSNMTKRMQDSVKEEIDFLGPIRISEVEEAQQKIIQIIQKLENANQIVINRGGEGDTLV